MVYEQEAQKTKYTWREGFPTHGVSAQVVGETLDAICTKHGFITPELICAEAAKQSSPLRPFIEQDRKKAATEYQRAQAVALRAAVKICWVSYSGPEPSTTVVQAFVRHPFEEHADPDIRGHVFVPVTRIMSEPEARAAHIRMALQELAAWQRRYMAFKELAQVFAAIEAATKKVKRVLPKIEEDAG